MFSRRACHPSCLVIGLLAITGSAAAQTLTPALGWFKTWGPTGTAGTRFFSVAQGISSDIYVLGQAFRSATGEDAAVVKYTNAGQLVWERYWNGTANGAESSADIAVDGGNNAVIVGRTQAAGNGGVNGFVARYSSAGTLLWSRSVNGAALNSDDALTGVAVDASNNIYVVGWTEPTAGDRDMILQKLSPVGALLWTRSWSLNPLPATRDEARDVMIAPSGDVMVTGFSQDASLTGSLFAACYRATDGFRRWVQPKLIGPNSRFNAMEVDQAGNVSVSGTRAFPSPVTRVYSWSATGALRYDQGVTHSTGWITGLGMEADLAGNLILGGQTNPSAGSGNGWIGRVTATGSPSFSTLVTNSSKVRSGMPLVAVDQLGGSIVANYGRNSPITPFLRRFDRRGGQIWDVPYAATFTNYTPGALFRSNIGHLAVVGTSDPSGGLRRGRIWYFPSPVRLPSPTHTMKGGPIFAATVGLASLPPATGQVIRLSTSDSTLARPVNTTYTIQPPFQSTLVEFDTDPVTTPRVVYLMVEAGGNVTSTRVTLTP